MRYTFKDIMDDNLYDESRVLIIVGQYSIFNSLCASKLRDRCKSQFKGDIDKELLQEFGIEDTEEGSNSNIVDFDTFTRVINTTSIDGDWYCSVDYSYLSKKAKDWLYNYIKNPSNNGRIAVICDDYRVYKSLLRSKIISNSKKSNIIQLSYPNRNMLGIIVSSLFSEYKVDIESRAVELFIMRMSDSYEKYTEIVQKIVVENSKSNVITYEMALQSLKGIENFAIDDFIDKLLDPVKPDSKQRRIGRGEKVYKMLHALIEEYGAIGLVNILKQKTEVYMLFREAINCGKIPIKVRFSVPEAKRRIGEESRIAKYSDYAFRKMALIASKTSLRDWTLMNIELRMIVEKGDSIAYEKALYRLVNRNRVSRECIEQAIGIKDHLNDRMKALDNIRLEDKV